MANGGGMEVKNLGAVTSAILAQGTSIEAAAIQALAAVAFVVEGQAKKNAATGSHARGLGHIPGTGPGPNRVSGKLWQSIHTENKKGFGSYTASVGPGVDYARAVELGNPRWKGGVKYPYLSPAAESIRPMAQRIFTANFLKRWRP